MKKSDITLLIIILLIGFASFFFRLDKTSLRMDEARIGSAAIRFIQGTDRILDTKALPHESPLIGYFNVPALWLFGNSLFGLKVTLAFFYFVVLIGIFLLTKELNKSESTAFIAMMLFLSSSLIIEFSKNMWEISPIPLATTYFLLFFFRFTRTGKPIDFVFAAGFLSLGIAIKLIFVYFIISFGLALLFAGRNKLEQLKERIVKLDYLTRILASVLFLILQTPFIYKTLIATNPSPLLNLTRSAILNAISSDIITALFIKLENLFIFSFLFIAAMVYFIVLKRESVLVLTCLLIIPLLIFTPNIPHYYHYLVLVPIPFIICGDFVISVMKKIKMNTVYVIVLILVLIMVFGVINYNRVYSRMEESNIRAKEVRTFFNKLQPQKIVTSDSYVFDVIQFLTYNRFEMDYFDIYDGPNSYEQVYNESKLVIGEFIEEDSLRYIVFGRLESNYIHGRLKEEVFLNTSSHHNISFNKYSFGDNIIVYEKKMGTGVI